jgi:crotonobetainyl-CoA:carnitine CoA-transferase CaiB-like acyl-CoA transferase
MKDTFKNMIVVELAGVLAGPSVGLFFAELGATVIKIENPKTKGDVTRSWKLRSEPAEEGTSAYYWSVNVGKEVIFLDLTDKHDLEKFYTLIKIADILVSNYKTGDDVKLKVDYATLHKHNPQLIYASINGFGTSSPRSAYDLILQAESGFMFMNGEKNAKPLKMPVALIDLLAGHQLKEAILLALIKKHKTQKGSYVSVSLLDAAISSLANQATNWLIAHHLPVAQGSLHPNIAPYGELFETQNGDLVTFAIGNDKQFQQLCNILQLDIASDIKYSTNQQRVTNRDALFTLLQKKIKHLPFQQLFDTCLKFDIPIGKIRDLKEVFELPEAQEMLKHKIHKNNRVTTVRSVAFKFHEL